MQKTNPDEETDLQSLIDSIKSDLSSYIEKKLTIYKLKTYEKLSVSSSYIVYGLIISLLVFSIFFLGLFALGFLLGEYLGSNAAGFGILILFSALILAVFVFNAKRVRRYFTNLIVRIIQKIESDED